MSIYSKKNAVLNTTQVYIKDNVKKYPMRDLGFPVPKMIYCRQKSHSSISTIGD